MNMGNYSIGISSPTSYVLGGSAVSRVLVAMLLSGL